MPYMGFLGFVTFYVYFRNAILRVSGARLVGV